MTRWSFVLHSKDLLFPWGPMICNPPGPCARRRSMDTLIICYWLDDLSSDNFVRSKILFGESWSAKKNRRLHLLGEPGWFDIERVEAQI